MNAIKVVFAFDENYAIQGLIAALSLLDSSLRRENGSKYEIFFLVDKMFSSEIKEKYDKFYLRIRT